MFKNLKLTAPIVFFDLETTGVDPATARIVEIAWMQIDPDGSVRGQAHRINPGISIPAGASAVHGIMDSDVTDMPTFDKMLCCPDSRPFRTSPDSRCAASPETIRGTFSITSSGGRSTWRVRSRPSKRRPTAKRGVIYVVRARPASVSSARAMQRRWISFSIFSSRAGAVLEFRRSR